MDAQFVTSVTWRGVDGQAAIVGDGGFEDWYRAVGRRSTISISGSDGRATVDPETLEIAVGSDDGT